MEGLIVITQFRDNYVVYLLEMSFQWKWNYIMYVVKYSKYATVFVVDFEYVFKDPFSDVFI